MIQSLARGRAYDDERVARRVDAELFRQERRERRVRLEVREINVLLDSRVPPDLLKLCAKAPQRLFGKSLGHDDARGEAKREMVRGLMLVVHQRDRAQAQSARRQDLRVRVMTD